MSLKEYNKKRDFSKTKEPKGKLTKTQNCKKFVIQYHQARAKHYDFRLEHNGVLLSWAVPKGLSDNPKDKRLAVHVEDHPLSYINFEGIIPKENYGAGSVEVYDKGTYAPVYSITSGLKKGHLKFILNGQKHKGEYSLVKTDEKNWLIIKSDDEFADNSPKKRKNTALPFDNANVQLATLTDKIPKGKEWIFEIKYDGYRIISYIQDSKVKMLTRNNQDYTKKFESLAKSLKKLPNNAVVDGEVVVFDSNGRSDFSSLQNTIKHGGNTLNYVIFDVLAIDGEDLRQKPLKQRKEALQKLMAKADDNLIFSSFVQGKGKQSFALAKKLNLEGIVAKNFNSTYSGKRTEDWLKIKCYKRQEFVIGGFTTTSKNQYLSALLLGYYKNKQLIFVGKVGTGFSDEQKVELNKKFKKLQTKDSPFKNLPKSIKANFIEPILVAEIQFAELTQENVLRQPSFIALREDKDAKDVKLEVKK